MRGLGKYFKWLKAELRYRLTGKRYKIQLTPLVEKQLSELPDEDRNTILEAIYEVSKNPYIGEPLTEDEIKELQKELTEAELSKGRPIAKESN